MHFNRIITLLGLIIISFTASSQQDSLWIQLDQQLIDSFDNQFAFSVLVGDGKEILFENYYGWEDDERHKRNSNQTLFQIASINKSITALGIFILIEQERLRLEDTLAQFFTNVPEDKRSISIQQLLSHQSGFGQNYVCAGIDQSDKALEALLRDSLAFKPGEAFGYSNQNYEMLALIIEKITEMLYEDYIRESILMPLEMNQTFFWHEMKGKKHIASTQDNIEKSIRKKNWEYVGSGGIFSTVQDLYKFMKGVIDNRLISSRTTSKMFANTFKTPGDLFVCSGWFRNTSREVWTRGSESWGHNAVIRWFGDKQRIIIVCTNSGEFGEKKMTGNRMVSDLIVNSIL